MRVVTPAGETITLGTTETGVTIGIIDYSRRVTDDFGVTTVVPRSFARRMSVRIAVPFDQIDQVQRRLAELRATPARWIADDRFASLDVQGYYKDFSLDLAVPPIGYCSLSVEGLAEPEAPVDAGGDPAPDGQASTLRLLQPVTVADGVLSASSVPEDDAPAWGADMTYPAGARVVRAHRVYEGLIAGNVGRDPAASAGGWLDLGPTNGRAMFDQALGTATVAVGSIVVTLAPGAVGGVALLDVVAATVQVQAGGYDRTVPVVDGAAMLLDMPNTGGPVTVRIAGSGTISVGTLLIGPVVGMGITEASPTAGITDFSRKVVDDFGEVTVVTRAWAKKMTAKAAIRADAVDLVAARIAAVRARPSLWIGQDGLASLTIYGFFKDFSIEVIEGISKLSLSIEGLSRAATVAPLKAIADWPSLGDPDSTKPADNATNSRDPASPFGPDRTVGDAIDDMTRLATTLQEIKDIFGDPDSSEAAAAATLAARDAAIQAQANAQSARDQAQAARDAAGAAYQQALDAANLASSRADAAGGSATAAAGSQAGAASSAGAAGQQASAAEASAVRATARATDAATAAGASAVAASGAASSASAAGQSASAARSAALLAETVQIATLPERFADRRGFTLDFTTPPDAAMPLPDTLGSFGDFAVQGRTLVLAGTRTIANRGWLALSPGRTWRTEASLVLDSAAPAGQSVTVMLLVFDAAGTFLGAASAGIAGYPNGDWPAGSFLGLSGETTTAAIMAAHPAAAYIRGYVQPIVTDPAVSYFLAYLRLRDETSVTEARLSAAASVTAASSAAASRQGAEQQAAATTAERIAAQTARGDAESFRDQSATSASGAAGSAGTASQQAGLAAGARDAAGGFAGAALTSAEVASARASEAGVQATIAGQHRAQADASAGGAAGSASLAGSFAAAASSEAAAAQQSATLSAQQGVGAYNAFPTFGSYPDPAGYPTGWSPFGSAGQSGRGRGVGLLSPYGFQQTNHDAGGTVYPTVGIVQTPDTTPALGRMPGGWIVVTATITYHAGDLRGAGVFLYGRDGGTGHAIDFAAARTTDGVVMGDGAGHAGMTKTYSLLVNIAIGSGLILHAMTAWDGFYGAGMVFGARNLTWHQLAVRAATSEEIALQTVKSDVATSRADISSLAAVQVSDRTAIATRVDTVSARVGMVESGLSVTQSAAATALGRTQAFFQIASIGPDGKPLLTVYYVSENGQIQEGVEVLNLRVRGTFIVDKTIGWDQINFADARRKDLRSWTGSLQTSLGQAIVVPIGFTLPGIRPGGEFQIEHASDVRGIFPERTVETRDGRPFYTNRLNDGGLSVMASDGQGRTYRPGSAQLVIVDNDSPAPFDMVWTATLASGAVDTGIVDQGDYYERNVSQIYALTGAHLRVKWSGL